MGSLCSATHTRASSHREGQHTQLGSHSSTGSGGTTELCRVQTHLKLVGMYLTQLSHASAAHATAATLLFVLALAL